MRYWFVDCENICNIDKFFNVFNGYDRRDKVLCVYSNKSIYQKNKFADTKPNYIRSDYCMVSSGRQKVDLKIVSLVRRHLSELCINNEGVLDICREVIIISNDKGYLRYFSNMNVTLRNAYYRKTPKMYISSYTDMYRVECTNIARKSVEKRRLRSKKKIVTKDSAVEEGDITHDVNSKDIIDLLKDSNFSING